jgi:hypothetical protein
MTDAIKNKIDLYKKDKPKCQVSEKHLRNIIYMQILNSHLFFNASDKEIKTLIEKVINLDSLSLFSTQAGKISSTFALLFPQSKNRSILISNPILECIEPPDLWTLKKRFRAHESENAALSLCTISIGALFKKSVQKKLILDEFLNKDDLVNEDVKKLIFYKFMQVVFENCVNAALGLKTNKNETNFVSTYLP